MVGLPRTICHIYTFHPPLDTPVSAVEITMHTTDLMGCWHHMVSPWGSEGAQVQFLLLCLLIVERH